MSLDVLYEKSLSIRKNILEMLTEAGSGHPGGSLGMADIFTALYFDIAHVDPKNPLAKNRDYIFLSNGHICPVWYATLAERGFFPKKELKTLRKLDSRLQGHPHVQSVPGVENSAGPLAQGLSVAVGAALALHQDNKKNTVFCVCGDGELDEGEVWEAALLASKYKLSNFVQIIDNNNIQLDGPTKEIMDLSVIRDKFLAFGYTVFECDGNDMADVLVTLRRAVKDEHGPKVVIAHTTPGKGVSFMENDYRWHGKAPSQEELERALAELHLA
ncbi:MAG: transketolase [Candidatus Woesearchaeota archaeon]